MLNIITKQRQPLILLIVITVVSAVIFALLIFQDAIALDVVFNDVAAEANIPIYVGIISNIGIYIWFATATICLFMSVFALRQQWPIRYRVFWIYASVIFLVLALDDAFLLHEEIIPELLGISESVTFGFYGVMLLVFVALFFRIIIKTNFTILFIALGFMVLGGAFDVLQPTLTNWYYTTFRGDTIESVSVDVDETADEAVDDVVTDDTIEIPERDVSWAGNAMDVAEDGPKLLAIVFFCLYFSMTAGDQLVAYARSQLK